MKKVFFLIIVVSLSLSACLPAILQPQATASLVPISVEDLQGTATVLAQESLQSLPTATVAPSDTPAVETATNTPTQEVPTETQNPVLLTLTATLSMGVVIQDNGTTATPSVVVGNTPTIGTPHPLHSGTMPPNLPFGKITLINRSKAEVYISLRCVTKDDYVTIIEYPVSGMVKANAPAGKYTYVVWVGGRQILGDFTLDKSQDLTIRIFKDRIEIK